jgi:hypothetical protein
LWNRLNGSPGAGGDRGASPMGLPLPLGCEEGRRAAIQALNVELDGLEKKLQVGAGVACIHIT